jgi:hypothetical protein
VRKRGGELTTEQVFDLLSLRPAVRGIIHSKVVARTLLEIIPHNEPHTVPDFIKEVVLLLRTTLIALAVAMTASASAQQSPPEQGIRVITPYSEHIYSADPATPQRLLDDDALRQENARAARRRQFERERRQEEMGAE